MIIYEDDLPKIRKKYQDKKIVFTSGTFDLVHPGHLEFLEWCKQQGDISVVAVNNDRHTKQVKGDHRPVLNQDDRIKMIDALTLVDYTVLNQGAGEQHIVSIQTANKLQPDVVVLGYDWAEREIHHWKQGLPKTKVVVAPPRQPGRSTSHIIKSIIKAHSDE